VGTLNHPNSSSDLLDLTVREFLEVLASSASTPGGGAAAALVGSFGAALVEMTANLTVGKPKFAAVEEQSQKLRDDSGKLRAELADGVQADASAFVTVTDAYKMPRATDEDKAARSAAIQKALVVAAQPPLDAAQQAAQVLKVAEEAAPVLNPGVVSDVLVGALFAHAALESAILNVEINLKQISDPAKKAELQSAIDAARQGAAESLARTLEVGRARMG
jgi:formiminotetrahydrofolate cyclodeaminase